MSLDPSCIFCKIIAGQIPCTKVYEDEDLLVFNDIHPWAPVHFLIVPKTHIVSLYDTTPQQHEKMLGRMLALAPKLIREQGVTNGFRTLINTGADGMQEVQHLHMHVMGGPRPWARG
ncbi:MAG: histidine triad nucleotide-binding protein [Betaproteobacteria bacterium]|jgi:histidine triad (HIT) family protein|nr:MAG: histidine triad nucleotide-binding protein [Betaproteobacteria bacterium]